MINNVSKITYDLGNIKNLTIKSNKVGILVSRKLLQVCISAQSGYVYINIFNNTGLDIDCLNVIDHNNKFKYKQKKLSNNKIKVIKYQKYFEPQILIFYSERINNNLSTVYLGNKSCNKFVY